MAVVQELLSPNGSGIKVATLLMAVGYLPEGSGKSSKRITYPLRS